MKRILQLVDHLHIATEETAIEKLLDQYLTVTHPFVIAFVNAHAVNLMYENPALCEALLQADHVFRDGSGMALLLRWQHKEAGLNLNGTDFIPSIAARYRNRRVAVIGTCEPYLQAAVQHLQQQGCDVVVQCDGFQNNAYYLDVLKQQPVALILLGMGMPQQELLSQQLREQLDYPCVIVNGGAILDFWAGRFPRAPLWMQRRGIEWLYRLWQEPKRLAKRYVIGNPLFVYRAWRLSR